MNDMKMTIFSKTKNDVKTIIDKELLEDVGKSYAQSEGSYPQFSQNSVDNSLENSEKDTNLKNLYQSWRKFDSLIEKNFEKSKQEEYNSANCGEDELLEINDSVEQTNRMENMPKQKDIIKHFETNLQKYSSKCDISQEELESQEIPNSILQYLYSIFSKIGKRMFRKVLILMYSFKEIDIKDKVLILSALGYLISPIDMIPDTLLGVGFADDAVIVSYIFNKIISGVSEQTIKKVDNLLSLLDKSTKSDTSDVTEK